MSSLTSLILAPAGSIIALAFAGYLIRAVMKQEEGTEEMKKISLAVRKGASAYLRRQYTGVGGFFAVMFVILLLLASFGYLTFFVPFAFLTGGFFSGLSGFIGMKVATSANARTANACRYGLNKGLRVAFNSGAVMGLVVVGLGLLDISFWFYFLNWFYTSVQPIAADAERYANITSAMLTFGMGASSMALFARVGGGIFTKAADVGADLVGKVEAGIPEDDPRNPAVIADNVGDNVGDVAGMGADLYESYVGSIISSSALGVAAGLGLNGIIVPMTMAAVGVLASIVGTFLVRSSEEANQSALLAALRKGTYGSSLLIAILSYFLIRNALGPERIGVYFAVLSGLIAGNMIGLCTEYFTSDTYTPTKNLAGTSETGAATIIIGGLSLGMLSTALPVIIVGAAVLISYFVSGGASNFSAGLYGVGISAVGMLSTLGITLATDAYGPIADNAGGIAEMAHLPEEVRQRTDALDSLGNTTAATGKGFAIGSAALTALALIAAYTDEITGLVQRTGINFTFNTSILNPPVLVGLFIGGMLPFLFSALTMQAVGRAAQGIVMEVRRQFKEIKGLMEGTAEADYASCVDICTKAAQKEMVLPALIAIASPIVVGMLLGVNGVVGMLAGAAVCGFVMAIMMANAGGAWDNAKKYIESGHLGGKGSEQHKAAVVGDTVGDPFKDTSGPSINILIKLLSMVSIVFANFVLNNSLFK
ncbi:MAG: sodium-translocating pyrophosphatase [Clostridiales bacterium]|jgi:K(+)-stimulated pyrophosphate-energized sodium pump|nr:sodium-translocating pyrophosphatase [Clostridiales bacterium]